MKVLYNTSHFDVEFESCRDEVMFFQLLEDSLLNRQYQHLIQGASAEPWGPHAYTGIGVSGLQNLRFVCKDVFTHNIRGDFLEAGVWRGGSCIYMAALAKFFNYQKRVWVCDSFQGMPPVNKDCPYETTDYSEFTNLAVSVKDVANAFSLYRLLDYATFVEGWFSRTTPADKVDTLSVLRLDSDYYESTKVLLETLYPKLSEGGWCIVDDYDCVPGCNKAVDDYLAEHGIVGPFYRMNNDVGMGVYWKKATT